MTTTESIIAALAPHRDAGRAVAMGAYMRGQFPFLGIGTPVRRQAAKPILRSLKGRSPAELTAIADQLWQLPEREYQYVAIDLLAMHWQQFHVADLPTLQGWILRKSWWDSVDGLAGVIGDVLRFQHDYMDEALRHENFWMRRVALLHQLGWREKTSEEHLFRYSLALGQENEFFIQKAIGWALRDYAKYAPDNVARFIHEHKDRLSKLSIREAGKHLSPLAS